jgi:hypothetical protein
MWSAPALRDGAAEQTASVRRLRRRHHRPSVRAVWLTVMVDDIAPVDDGVRNVRGDASAKGVSVSWAVNACSYAAAAPKSQAQEYGLSCH